MRVPTVFTAAGLAAVAALALTACGGGGGSKSGEINGAQQTTSAAPTTSAPTGAPTTVPSDLALPTDLKVDFDWQTPSDPEQAAALASSANYIRSIAHGVVKRNASDPQLKTYAKQDAFAYGADQIQQYLKGGWTLTGTTRYYQPKVEMTKGKNAARVTFCGDASKSYGRVVTTGKVLYTQPSDRDFSFYSIVMTKLPTATELWQATAIDVQERATQCKP